jgi:hypothetical protein
VEAAPRSLRCGKRVGLDSANHNGTYSHPGPSLVGSASYDQELTEWLFNGEREDCRHPTPCGEQAPQTRGEVRLGEVGAAAAVEKIVRDTAVQLSKE